jgi:hypothetical protein
MNGILAAMTETSPTMRRVLRQFRADQDERHKRVVAGNQRRHAREAAEATDRYDRLKQIFLQVSVLLKSEKTKKQLIAAVTGGYRLPFSINTVERILYIADSREALDAVDISKDYLMLGRVFYDEEGKKLSIESVYVAAGGGGATDDKELMNILSEKVQKFLIT